jgi:hypothetical protein
MNEFEIRDRLRKALGQTIYPAGYASRIESRITASAALERSQRVPRMVALVAALLAIVIVAALVFISANRPTRTIPAIPLPSATTSPASPTPTPTPSASPTATPTPAAGVLCSLPMDKGTGAFLDVPAGGGDTVDPSTDDPTSNVNLPNGEARVALSYSWAFHRWLPVPSKWVVPDGAHYAYTDSQARVHLVDISGGSDQIVATGATWGLYGVGVDWIYVGQRDASRQPSLSGLWRIPMTGGTPQKLASQGTWLGIGQDAAWSMVQNGPPPSGWTIPENSFGTVLQRVDLNTGAIMTWYTSSTGGYRVGTVDTAGRPVLVGVSTAPQLLIVTGAGAADSYSSLTVSDVMADTHGVWFEDPMLSSVYLIQGSSPRRMGQYGTTGNFAFAGPCQ